MGTKSNKIHRSFKSEYSRAFRKHKENKLVQNIINKTSYKIEVIFESPSKNEILNKEIEFIKLYGRINLKTGCLANLTDGGESNNNRIGKKISNRHKKILSDRMKINNPNKNGKYLPFDIPGVREKVMERMKNNNPRKLFLNEKDIYIKKCYQYSLNGEFIKEWPSLKEAKTQTNIKTIGQCLTEQCKSAGGYLWKYDKLEKIDKYNPKKNFYKIQIS